MKTIKILSVFVLCALIALFFAAYITTLSLSTQTGKERLLQAINHRIPGKVSLDGLSLSWFSPSHAREVELKNPEGQIVARAKSIVLTTPLWRLLLPASFPEGAIEDFNLTLIADPNGLSNLEQALSFEAAKKNFEAPFSPLYFEKGWLNYDRNGQVKAEASTRQNEVLGTFNLEGDFSKTPTLTAHAKNLPTLLIDQLAQSKLNTPPQFLNTLIGETFDAETTLKGRDFKQTFTSGELNFTLEGALEKDTLRFRSPSEVVYEVTPEKLKRITNLFPDLKTPLKLVLQADDLALNLSRNSLDGNVKIFTDNATFDTAFIERGEILLNFDPQKSDVRYAARLNGQHGDSPLTASARGLFSQNKLDVTLNFKGKDFVLEGGKALASNLSNGTFEADLFSFRDHKTRILPSSWTHRQGEVHLNFKLSSDIGTLYGESQINPAQESVQFVITQSHGGGSFQLFGKILDAFKPFRTFHLNSELKAFPSEAIAAFLPEGSQLTNLLYSLFGYSITGQATADIVKMKGPFKMAMKGERCDLKLEGKVEGGVAYLTAPLTASIQVSKEVSAYFLDDILPLLNSAQKGDKPIELTIQPEGAFVPIRAASLATLNIATASLDLGKLYFTPDGKLAEVLSVLRLSPNALFNVWFTPLYFSLQNGRLNLQRIDMLINDRIPIATWGTIDFPQDQVRMQVGLTGAALTRTLGPLPLPRSYMLTIPLRGTTSNSKLDKTKIIAKLSALAAMATGPQGALVGALIQIASGSLTDTIPEPTTQPLPWTTEAEGAPEEDTSKESPIEQGAAKILNTVLG